MGFWVEIVTLIVPGFNDSDDELRRMAEFVASVSTDIPWHVTAFHGDYKMTEPGNTSSQTLVRAAGIGKSAGLHFVYAGNLPGRTGGSRTLIAPTAMSFLSNASASASSSTGSPQQVPAPVAALPSQGVGQRISKARLRIFPTCLDPEGGQITRASCAAEDLTMNPSAEPIEQISRPHSHVMDKRGRRDGGDE